VADEEGPIAELDLDPAAASAEDQVHASTDEFQLSLADTAGPVAELDLNLDDDSPGGFDLPDDGDENDFGDTAFQRFAIEIDQASDEEFQLEEEPEGQDPDDPGDTAFRMLTLDEDLEADLDLIDASEEEESSSSAPEEEGADSDDSVYSLDDLATADEIEFLISEGEKSLLPASSSGDEGDGSQEERGDTDQEASSNFLRISPPRVFGVPAEIEPAVYVRTLVALFTEGSSGVLVLEGGRVTRRIHISSGYPVWVEVDPPEDGICAFLLSEGQMEEKDVPEVTDLQRRLGWKAPRILVSLKLLPAPEVDEAMERWVGYEVGQGLRRRGKMSFIEDGELSGSTPVYEVHPLKAIWGGVQKSLRVGAAEVGLTRVEDAWMRVRPSQKALFSAIAKTGVRAQLAALLTDWRRLDDLREAFPDDWDQVVLALWTLVSGGLLEAAKQPVEHESGEEESQRAGHTLELSAEELASSRELASSLDGPTNRNKSQEEQAPEDPEERIHFDFRKKMELDHYAFLSVPKTASRDEIASAYDELAPAYRLGPQRKDFAADTKEHAKQLLARLFQAYETLSEAPRREAYDASLSGPTSAVDPAPAPQEESPPEEASAGNLGVLEFSE